MLRNDTAATLLQVLAEEQQFDVREPEELERAMQDVIDNSHCVCSVGVGEQHGNLYVIERAGCPVHKR